MLPAVGHVTPIATPRPPPPRNWHNTNDRLRDMADFTIAVDPHTFHSPRSGARGRAYHNSVIEAALIIAAVYHLPLRQTEGVLRAVCELLGVPKDHAPLEPGAGVVLVIDSTGARIDSRDRWLDEKPGVTGDPRRGWFCGVHVGIDAATARVVAVEVTRTSGRGTGDASVGRSLIDAAYRRVHESHTHLDGGLGDGAYDDKGCYDRMRRYGGRWYAPLPARAQTGSNAVRDTHVTGVRRLGGGYEDRLGYHQRSCVESTMGALKRTVGLRARARSFEVQRLELLTQVWVYDQGLVRYPR